MTPPPRKALVTPSRSPRDPLALSWRSRDGRARVSRSYDPAKPVYLSQLSDGHTNLLLSQRFRKVAAFYFFLRIRGLVARGLGPERVSFLAGLRGGAVRDGLCSGWCSVWVCSLGSSSKSLSWGSLSFFCVFLWLALVPVCSSPVLLLLPFLSFFLLFFFFFRGVIGRGQG